MTVDRACLRIYYSANKAEERKTVEAEMKSILKNWAKVATFMADVDKLLDSIT